MNLACPIDNKDDSIQKVSAVVASGQSIGTFSGPTSGTVTYDGKSGNVSGHSTLSGSSTSQLATLLSPPKEPAKPGGFGGLWVVLWIVPFFAASIIVNLSLLFTYVVSRDIADIVGAVLGTIVFVVAFIYLINFDKNKKAKDIVKYEKEKPKWDKAMSKWNRIYYCHKHDIVFDPESGESCSPSGLKNFLYQ